jgi:putative transposase
MSRKYKFNDQNRLYFISFSVVYWVDVFIRELYREELIKSLKFCQKHKGLEIYAWCLMPSHMHMIIGTHGIPMQDIMRDFKSYTSHELKKLIRENQQESRREWML